MTKKKSGKKAVGKSAGASAPPPDPRGFVPPTPKNLEITKNAFIAVLERLEVPPRPRPSDIVDAMIHIQISDGRPCGFGQEALRRFEDGFVDRNEFRVTEAFETEALLRDFGIDDLFERCKAVQESVGQVYNDQNGVTLDFLREAAVSERKSFFARVAALSPYVAKFVSYYVDFEEVLFSTKSTQRVQVRLGLDPKSSAAGELLDVLRERLRPFGHLPLAVGAHAPDRRPIDDPPLCPACLLIRHAPPGKR